MSLQGWAVTALGTAAWFGLCAYLYIANGAEVCP